MSRERAGLVPWWTVLKKQLKLGSGMNKASKAGGNRACYQGDILHLGGTAALLSKHPNSNNLRCAIAQKTTRFLRLKDAKLL